MGGKFYYQTFANEEYKIKNEKIDVEKYFRTSNQPVLNDKNLNAVMSNNYDKEFSEIKLPDILFKKPEYLSGWVILEAQPDRANKPHKAATFANDVVRMNSFLR